MLLELMRCWTRLSFTAAFAALIVSDGLTQVAPGAEPPPRPVTLEAVYTGEGVSAVEGGLRARGVYLDNLDVRLRIRGGPLVGSAGTSALIYVISNRGTNPSTYIGDAQGVSNIAAESSWRLYEAWIQQNLLQDRLSLLVGLYDLNTEFDAVQSAGLFLNSSFGIGPDYSQSGHNGPSIFPVTSLGLRVKVRPVPEFYIAAAVLDGVPGDPTDPAGVHVSLNRQDGALLATEVAVFAGARQQRALTARPGARTRNRQIGRGGTAARYTAKVALGAWVYSSKVAHLATADSGFSYGVYLLAERTVYRERGRDDGLTVFARVGLADAEVNRFGTYLGAGAVYSGLIPGRSDDEAGVAVAMARNGDRFIRATSMTEGIVPHRAETVFEFTYRMQLLSAFAIQPDLQWVIHPDTDRSIPNALVLGLRGEVSVSAW